MRIIIGIIGVSAGLLLGGSGFSQDSKSAQNIEALVSKANELYEQGDYIAAKGVCESILKLDAQNAVALFYLEVIPYKISEKEKYDKEQEAYFPYHQALALYDNKQYQRALEKFNEAERILPDYKRTKYYMERIPLDIEEEEKLKKRELEALVSLQKVSVEKAKDRAESLLKEGYNLYEEEKYLEAKAFYEEAAAFDPGNTVALFYLERIPDKIKEKEKYEIKQEAQSIYQQAVMLYQDNQYQRAIEKFKEVENKYPGYKQTRYFIKDLPSVIKRYEQELKVNDLKEKKQQLARLSQKYKKAVLAYRKKDYKKALEMFQEINQIYPAYRDSDEYFRRIERGSKIAKIENLLRQANALFKDKEYMEAAAAYQKALVHDPKNSIALSQLEIIPQKLREKKEWEAREKAGFEYRQGVVLYKNKEYKTALDKFKEVKILVSNYKDTERYISRIIVDMKNEEENEFKRLMESNYNEALRLYKKKNYLEALGKLRTVRESVPNYKKTQSYISSIFAQLQKIEKNKMQEEKLKEKAAEIKYNEACVLYNNRDYQSALEKYKQLDEFYPGYKDTFIYMHRITKKLEEDKINSLFKEGQVLYEEGYFDQAKAIFKTIIKFQPQNSAALTYLEQLSSKTDGKEELKGVYARIYQEAVGLYELKQYQAALKKFKEVKNILPDYDRTDHYLELISKAIFQEREQ